MKKITINDVAKYAGVSKKTISRVLNNEPKVSSDTKNKVKKAFKTLGYRPNPQARGLAFNQSFLIGLLYDNPNKNYVSEIQSGALERCKTDGYYLTIYPEDHENERLLENIENILIIANLDGIILTPPFSDSIEVLALLEQQKMPFVRIGATETMDDTTCVISNDFKVSFQMCRYLISLGHERIGFIKGHPDHHASNLRLLGYQKALQKSAIEVFPELITQGFFTFDSGEECAKKLISLKNRPTAIFASNDYMAAAVIKVASQKGLQVPHQLSVAGFDNAPIAGYIWPSLTTIKQPIYRMASEAAKLLIKMIKGKPLETDLITFESELIVRESSGPVTKKTNR